MSKEKKKILILCPYPEAVAPSQRLKYEQYFEEFSKNGYEYEISSFISPVFWNIVYKKGNILKKIYWTLRGYFQRIYDLMRLPFYDGVYVHLYVVPFGPPIFEWLASILNKNIIYDIDDLVFLKPTHGGSNPITLWLRPTNNSILMMKKAKHVITCTPYLDKFVRQYNQNTTDISSTIKTDIYRPRQDYTIKDKKIILGWSGSHSTAGFLKILHPVLLKLKEKYDFKLLVMGDASFYLEGIDVEALAWKEEYEVSTISRFDIGLYPLPDEEWVYGKSGLKALQYMALGIPTIATAIGANFRVIEDGKSGFLVNNDAEWLEKLSLLIENQILREKIGKAAAERVEEYYSINANKDAYLSIFDKVYRNNINVKIQTKY